MKRILMVTTVLAAFSIPATVLAGIVSISEVGNDAGRFAIIEPVDSSNGTTFDEDAWIFTDRNHEVNSATFDPVTGMLLPTAGTGLAADTFGIPSYLVGATYIANADNHRDNNPYELHITLDIDSYLYLLVDNRVGDGVYTTPPTLGSGGVGVMSWVTDMGFVVKNTGMSPNGQPDFVGIDEINGVLVGSDPENRSHNGFGAGDTDGFYTVYELEVAAGMAILGPQADPSGHMYVPVVVAVPEPSALGLVGLGLGLGMVLFWRRGRK